MAAACRSEEHTSELQSLTNLVCRLLLEKNKEEQADQTAALAAEHTAKAMFEIVASQNGFATESTSAGRGRAPEICSGTTWSTRKLCWLTQATRPGSTSRGDYR